MKHWPKEIIQPIAFTIMGAMFGVIGNFMVTSYYRVTDQLNLGSTAFDLLTFIVSIIVLFIFGYFFLNELKKQMKTED